MDVPTSCARELRSGHRRPRWGRGCLHTDHGLHQRAANGRADHAPKQLGADPVPDPIPDPVPVPVPLYANPVPDPIPDRIADPIPDQPLANTSAVDSDPINRALDVTDRLPVTGMVLRSALR